MRARLEAYDQIGDTRLRTHQVGFLSEVIPTAEKAGVNLCCHPDDPPFGLLGLPRILSTERDYARLFEAVDSPANGMTLCSGSLGVRADSDKPGIVDRMADAITELQSQDSTADMGHAEWLGLLIDREVANRTTKRFQSRLRADPPICGKIYPA